MTRDMAIREVSDREQIRDLLTLYCTAVDSKNYKLLDSCFTKAAKLDLSGLGGPVGSYAEFRQWLEQSLKYLDSMQHSITNTVFDIDGDSARAKTMFANINLMNKPDGSSHVFTVGGYYVDELVYTNEGWKINQRVEKLCYFDGERPSREALEVAQSGLPA